jgi:hypothetical protein
MGGLNLLLSVYRGHFPTRDTRIRAMRAKLARLLTTLYIESSLPPARAGMTQRCNGTRRTGMNEFD